MFGFQGIILEMFKRHFGPVAQLVRAPPCHGGGRGFESLLGRLIIWDHSSAGRAPALQAGGHRFEPCWSHFSKYADMAQLAEQLICNQQVNGSSPFIGFMDGFPSGQRGQTVNLLAPPSKVRILLHPLNLITRGGAVWKLVGLITRRS